MAAEAAWAWGGQVGGKRPKPERVYPAQNPLELRAAFVFALLFVMPAVCDDGGDYPLYGALPG